MHFVSKSTLNYLSSKYIVHLFVNIVVFSALAFVLPIRFETNDDIGMLAIASGNYLSGPDAHLVFINYIYGLLVSSLYKLYGGIEWYTLLFAIIHIVSWSIISWRIFAEKARPISKLVASLLFLSLEICCILYFQFTTTAAVCATGSVVLFMASRDDKLRILAILLFFLGTLIRFEAACLVLLLSTPLFVKELFAVGNKQLGKYMMSCCILVALPIAAKIADKKIYDSDAEWKYYKEYNLLRGGINDNLNAYVLKELPQEVTETDYNLFLHFFADCSVMTLDVIQDITSRIDRISISDKMHNLLHNTIRYRIPMSFVFLLCLTVFLLQKDKKNRSIVALIFGLLVFVIVFVSLDALLKERVFISMLIPVCWMLYSIFIHSEKQSNRWVCFFMLGLSLLLTASLHYKYINPEIKKNERKQNRDEPLTLEVIDYMKTLNDEYIMQYQGGVRLQHLSPFKTSEYIEGLKWVNSGWYSYIPFNKGVFDSYKDIIDKNYVLVAHVDKDKLVGPIKESVRLHYGISVEPKTVYESNLYSLIRFVSVNN